MSELQSDLTASSVSVPFLPLPAEELKASGQVRLRTSPD